MRMLNKLVSKLDICAQIILYNIIQCIYLICKARFSIPLYSPASSPLIINSLSGVCSILFQPCSRSLLCHFVSKIFYILLSSPHFTWAPNMSTCLPLLAALNPVQWSSIINLLIVLHFNIKNVMLEQYI